MQTKHDDNIRWPQNGQIMSARAEKKKFYAGAECKMMKRKMSDHIVKTFMKIQ